MVHKAVIPAAGLGSRMLPVTKVVPKELLPVGSLPMIHHVVEEVVASGCEEICIVIRLGKESIRDYFEKMPHSSDNSRGPLANLVALSERCKIHFAFQEKPLGIGDALVAARDFVRDDAFFMAIPDQLFLGENLPLVQMRHRPVERPFVISSMIKLAARDAAYFEGARSFVWEKGAEKDGLFEITGIQERPPHNEGGPTDKHLVVGFGRTIFPPEIFRYLGRDAANPRTGEIDLLKTFEASFGHINHYAVLLSGHAFDLGSLKGYQHFLPILWKSLA